MNDVVIIGGGAAGMMAGINMATQGYKTVIYEKNDRLGRKLFITGKGRCNLTNNCDADTFFSNVVTNPKFLYSAYQSFDTNDTMDFFEKCGLKIKTERGGRVFPESDHSSDVIRVLSDKLCELGVLIKLNTEVKEIMTEDCDDIEADNGKNENMRQVTGVKIKEKGKQVQTVMCKKVIVATGGASYPLTGSTGDGFKWANDMGINVSPVMPSLIPLNIEEEICKDLMGLSLKNVNVSFVVLKKGKEKVVYSDFGEMLFTHFGVSGPVVLSASSNLHKYIDSGVKMVIDFKPALSRQQLDERLLRDFSSNINKQFRNAISDLLPKRLLPYVISMSGIDQYKKVNEITKGERQQLIECLKSFTLNVKGFRDISEAIITHGGISVKEINPKNMESKKVKGLHFIGEVLDVDALTGGFNLQIAWSTAWALN